MANKKIRIIPVRRELDLEKLAEALLSMLNGLSPEDRKRFEKLGQLALEGHADKSTSKVPRS